MAVQTVLITGATSGIGREIARALAEAGHRVIVHGRNEAKTRTVAEELKADTGNTGIDYLVADLLSLAAIASMAKEFNQKYGRLDVLINNAGAVMDNRRALTVDGIESTMALNVLAPFLLNQLLLPALEKSADGRIINMSSEMYRVAGTPDLNNLNFEGNYSAQRRYNISKLYLIWLTQYHAQLLRQNNVHNVSINAVYPGMVATNFGRNGNKGLVVNAVYKALRPFMAGVQKGAATAIYLATSDEVRGISGKFFGNMKEQQVAARYNDQLGREKLWKYCTNTVAPYLP